MTERAWYAASAWRLEGLEATAPDFRSQSYYDEGVWVNFSDDLAQVWQLHRRHSAQQHV